MFAGLLCLEPHLKSTVRSHDQLIQTREDHTPTIKMQDGLTLGDAFVIGRAFKGLKFNIKGMSLNLEIALHVNIFYGFLISHMTEKDRLLFKKPAL